MGRMSAPFLPTALPLMALQLAVLTEKYCRAIESECAAGGDSDAVAASAGILRQARALASAVPPLWVDWGQLMVDHNELMQVRIEGGSAGARARALHRVTTRAHMFTSRCVHWALFEQSLPSVPFQTSDAFIAWEGARRSAWELREQIDAFVAESQSDEVPAALDEIATQSQRNADRLLVHAVTFLEGSDGATDASAPPRP
jgi:hypothetical protein